MGRLVVKIEVTATKTSQRGLRINVLMGKKLLSIDNSLDREEDRGTKGYHWKLILGGITRMVRLA